VTTQLLLGLLASDRGYPGIAEFVSRHFFFHQMVLMDGQPTADSGQACTVILNIDSCQQPEDCLTRFFAEEALIPEGENGLRQQRTKKIVFDTVPALLILYPGGFDFDELGQFAKNQHVITFPLEIDLRPLILEQSDRDVHDRLEALAKHRGMDIDQGHCIAMYAINGPW
jgi:hypothetical protein